MSILKARSVPSRIIRRVSSLLVEASLKASFKHLHGPRRVTIPKNGVALVLVGRNNGSFLPENIAHHRRLGVSHIIYVDNDSSDDSVAIVKSQENSTVYKTKLNFREHQAIIRKFAVSRVRRGGWVLAIDCDELFDYPGSDVIRINELVKRLADRGHTGVVAQMLDLVPKETLRTYIDRGFSGAINDFIYYNNANFAREAVQGPNTRLKFFLGRNKYTDPNTELLYGGIRSLAFGEDCCLTKHPLFRYGKGVIPFAHPHVSTGLICSDFTAVLKHYKFACGVVEREEILVREKRMSNGEIDLRVKIYSGNDTLNLFQHTNRVYDGIGRLYEDGFLAASEAAQKMLQP